VTKLSLMLLYLQNSSDTKFTDEEKLTNMLWMVFGMYLNMWM